MMNKKFGRSADIAVAEMVSTNNKNDQRVFMTIPVIDKEWIALPVGQSQNFVGLDCSTPNGETASWKYVGRWPANASRPGTQFKRFEFPWVRDRQVSRACNTRGDGHY